MKKALIALAFACSLPAAHAETPKEQLTASNRQVVEKFADLFYRQRKIREAFETYVNADKYIQHNPGLPDGREAAIVALEPMFQAASFQASIERTIVEGDLAIVHLRVQSSPSQRAAAVADIFRLENGKIVEHWDVLQSMPEKSANPHPMF